MIQNSRLLSSPTFHSILFSSFINGGGRTLTLSKHQRPHQFSQARPLCFSSFSREFHTKRHPTNHAATLQTAHHISSTNNCHPPLNHHTQKRHFLSKIVKKLTNNTTDDDDATHDTKPKKKKTFGRIDLSKKAVMKEIRDKKEVSWQLANLPTSQMTQMFKAQNGKLFITPFEPLLDDFTMRMKDSKLYSTHIRNVNNQPIPVVNLWNEDRISVLTLSFTTTSRKWIAEFQDEIMKLEKDPKTKWTFRLGASGVGSSAEFAQSKQPAGAGGSKKYPVSLLSMVVSRSYWERKFFGEKMASSVKKDVQSQFYPNTVVVLDPLETLAADMRLKNVYTSYMFIIDNKGWIRWCCSGQPTKRDIISFDRVLTRLHEERS